MVLLHCRYTKFFNKVECSFNVIYKMKNSTTRTVSRSHFVTTVLDETHGTC